MSIFDWNDRFSVGISDIDDEHKFLVGFINQLNDAMRVGRGSQELGSILDQLVEYTIFHFGHEEQLMKAYAYPERAYHINEHLKLTQQVADFQIKFQGGQSRLSIQLVNFLKEWLSIHILVEDKKMCAFLIKKGAPAR